MKFSPVPTAVMILTLISAQLLTGCSVPEPTIDQSSIELSDCSDLTVLPSAQCGSIEVHLDRSDPSAGTTTVAFAVVPRRDKAHPSLGTIVPNPGGPGTSTIDYAGELYAAGLEPLLDRRDLLLVDPRGVGRSDPISCATLDTADLAFGTVDEQRRAIGECGADLGDRAGHYGTAEVADDIEAIRSALDLGQIDLFGDSYGTFLMATYAQRHPEQVRSIVLSGAYAVNEDSAGAVAAVALRRAVSLVGTRTGAFDGASTIADLSLVADELRRTPRAAEITFAGVTRSVPIDEAALAGAVGKLFAGSPDAQAHIRLATAARSAALGDTAEMDSFITDHMVDMAEAFTAGPGVYAGAASWATACHDYPVAFDREGEVQLRSQQLDQVVREEEAANDFTPFSAQAWLSRDSFDHGACLYWPAMHAGPPYEPGATMPDVPVLVLTGDLDANTSSASGRAAAAEFPNAEWVEVENAGHTPSGSEEGLALILDFFKKNAK